MHSGASGLRPVGHAVRASVAAPALRFLRSLSEARVSRELSGQEVIGLGRSGFPKRSAARFFHFCSNSGQPAALALLRESDIKTASSARGRGADATGPWRGIALLVTGSSPDVFLVRVEAPSEIFAGTLLLGYCDQAPPSDRGGGGGTAFRFYDCTALRGRSMHAVPFSARFQELSRVRKTLRSFTPRFQVGFIPSVPMPVFEMWTRRASLEFMSIANAGVRIRFFGERLEDPVYGWASAAYLVLRVQVRGEFVRLLSGCGVPIEALVARVAPGYALRMHGVARYSFCDSRRGCVFETWADHSARTIRFRFVPSRSHGLRSYSRNAARDALLKVYGALRPEEITREVVAAVERAEKKNGGSLRR